MSRTYPVSHPDYGSNAIYNADGGDYCYRVTGSNTHIMLVEAALAAGRSVDEIVADPDLECEYARTAVQYIYAVWHNCICPQKVAA